MVRPRKTYICKVCSTQYPKWQGVCKVCGRGGEIIENFPAVVSKPRATPEQRRLMRRSKDSERSIARRMLEADGPDPMFKNIASSTGRIGFITGMQVDAISKSYVTENKNRKLPLWLIAAWVQINQKAVDFNKNALLHVEPPNMPRDIPINGVKSKLDTMAIITQGRHEDLIRSEKALTFLLKEITTSNSKITKATLDEVYAILHPHSTTT